MTSPETTEPSFEELAAAYERSLGEQEFEQAFALIQQMNDQAEPRHFETLYNAARLACLLGRNEEAYRWLKRAIDAGYWDVQTLRGDDAFGTIRQEERFAGLARGAWVRSYILMLERAERSEFQMPGEIMRTLAFRPGERVADVGAGSGYFTIPVARAVGPAGFVLAIDIFQEMLDCIAERLAWEKIENVRLLKVSREDPMLPPGGIDTILLIDALHYVQDRVAFAGKLRAGLAPEGRIVLIDYRPAPWEKRPWGPPPEQQIPREVIDAEMCEAGMTVTAAYEFLPEQYFVVYGAS